MDVTEMSDCDLFDMLARNRRDFVLTEPSDAWAVWQRIVPLVGERERRRMVRESLSRVDGAGVSRLA
jgi:hypothetical protein